MSLGNLWSHFDKLLLATLFLLGMILLLHMTHHAADVTLLQSVVQWVGQILAALLTLMVGQRMSQRKADDGAPTPPETPKA